MHACLGWAGLHSGCVSRRQCRRVTSQWAYRSMLDQLRRKARTEPGTRSASLASLLKHLAGTSAAAVSRSLRAAFLQGPFCRACTPCTVRWPKAIQSACTVDVPARATLQAIGDKPMDNVLEILQALALVASIAKAAPDIVREVDEMSKEFRHRKG